MTRCLRCPAPADESVSSLHALDVPADTSLSGSCGKDLANAGGGATRSTGPRCSDTTSTEGARLILPKRCVPGPSVIGGFFTVMRCGATPFSAELSGLRLNVRAATIATTSTTKITTALSGGGWVS